MQFRESPRSVAEQLGLTEEDARILEDLDFGQLDQQAQTLVGKRRHEVFRMLPKTVAKLGEDAREAFDFFAEGFWPESHLRHVEDALGFARFIHENKLCKCNAAEINHLRMRLSQRDSQPPSEAVPHDLPSEDV